MSAPGTSPRAGRDDWMDDAICWWMVADEFHPTEQGSSADIAKRSCRVCPVTVECITYAMRVETNSYREGVYGGYAPNERYELARRGWKPGDPLPPIRTRSEAHRTKGSAA